MITVVGSYGAGLTMRSARMPVAGETLSDGEFSTSHGGKGSNQAVAAARLGSEVEILSAVGRDAFGAAAFELWRQEGIAAEHVIRSDAATMVGVILVDSTGENRIVIAPGALDELSSRHIKEFESRIAASDLLIVSLEIPLEAALAALKIARENGVRTLLNPAPAQRIPDEAWQWIDVITPNATEGRIMLGLDPADATGETEVISKLREVYGGIVVMTLGSSGAFVDDGADQFLVPPVTPRVVVDTTGAGDTFTGALGHALTRGDDLRSATEFAAAAGAYAVGISEVIPSIPTAAELDSFIAESRKA